MWAIVEDLVELIIVVLVYALLIRGGNNWSDIDDGLLFGLVWLRVDWGVLAYCDAPYIFSWYFII